jgi:hypothetical protein
MARKAVTQNLLYYGDNLDVLQRHVADESVGLVYLDPPFNSNRAFNVFFSADEDESALVRYGSIHRRATSSPRCRISAYASNRHDEPTYAVRSLTDPSFAPRAPSYGHLGPCGITGDEAL